MARPERLLGLRPRPFGAAAAARRRSALPPVARRTPDRLVRSVPPDFLYPFVFHRFYTTSTVQ